jgi:Rieske 2Fe-2S family protein
MVTAVPEIHRSAVSRTREALSKARHLPGDFYTSREIAAAEREHIFGKEWLCVGRVEEFEKSGDYRTLELAGEPIVVCRSKDGELRAFYNVCRHRGTEVATGCGNRNSFQCPYHAWTYDLEGKLLGAPFTDDIDGFDRKDFGLKSIQLDTWGGFVFVNLDPACRPLADSLGSFTEVFAPYRPEECRLGFRIRVEYNSNWKAVAENFVDIYHLATLHAESFGDNQPLDSYEFTLYPWGYTGRFKGVSPMTLDGKPRYGFMPWLEGDHLEYGYSSHLFPNMGFYARQDNIHWVTQWPIDVGRSAAEVHIMFPKEFHERPDFTAKLADYEECLNVVIEEDMSMISALQKGFASKGFEPGPMSRFERAVHHVIQYNLDRVYGRSR